MHRHYLPSVLAGDPNGAANGPSLPHDAPETPPKGAEVTPLHVVVEDQVLTSQKRHSAMPSPSCQGSRGFTSISRPASERYLLAVAQNGHIAACQL